MTAKDTNIEGQAYLPLSRAWFLHLGPVDILGQVTLLRGCRVPCRLFSSIPDLHPPDARSVAPLPTPAVAAKNVSRSCQMPPLGQNGPWLRTTGLDQDLIGNLWLLEIFSLK